MCFQLGLDGNSINLLATGVVGIINFISTIPTIMFIDKQVAPYSKQSYLDLTII